MPIWHAYRAVNVAAKTRQPMTHTNQQRAYESIADQCDALQMLTRISKCRRQLCQSQWSEREHPKTGAKSAIRYLCVCVRRRFVDMNCRAVASSGKWRTSDSRVHHLASKNQQKRLPTPYLSASLLVFFFVFVWWLLNVRWFQRTANIVYSVRWIVEYWKAKSLKFKIHNWKCNCVFLFVSLFFWLKLISFSFFLFLGFAWMRTLSPFFKH